jgi:sugar/nucleoside kinase (ribokinase family)
MVSQPKSTVASKEKPVVFDVLVAGEINPDLILTGADLQPRFGQHEILVDGAVLTIGSSSAIFACGAARLGLRVGFVGLAGGDLFGGFMLEALGARGVDVSPVIIEPAQRTGLSLILNRGADRAILTFPGRMSDLRAEQVSDDLLRRRPVGLRPHPGRAGGGHGWGWR